MRGDAKRREAVEVRDATHSTSVDAPVLSIANLDETASGETAMLKLLKRLLPDEPLPPHLHFHVDAHGNKVICDESVCRPETQRAMPLFLPFRY
jgi:hypothetical protein